MSEIQDQRPGNARRPNPDQPAPVAAATQQEMILPTVPDGANPDATIMAIKQANPDFSFARAEEVYHQHYHQPEPKLERPTFVDEELPEPATPVPPAPQTFSEQVQEHLHRAPEPVVEKAPAVEPSPQPKAPEAVAPAQPAVKEMEDAAPKVPEQQQMREIDFGNTHLAETAEMGEDEADRILTQSKMLIGLKQDPNIIADSLQKFLGNIKRSPKDGRLLFESPEQQQVYDDIYRALNMTPPRLQDGVPAFAGALDRGDTAWEQRVMLPDGKASGAIAPRDNMHTGALAALRRVRKSGIPNMVWLPATGIYVGFRAPHERDLCDFDMRLTLETATIGMQTYGLMLSSSSGVYMRHMVEFALQFVTEATIDCAGNDLRTVLLDTIDLADYWLVILGPLQAKWPSGIPWTLMCGEDGCTQQEDVKLNIARCIRFGSGLFSDLQKQLWARQRGTERPVISIAEQREYIAAHQVDPSSVFEYHDVRVEFGRSTLGSFFDSTEKWIEDVNASTTAALSEFATERERESHMRLTAEARRLTRYAHMVKSITVNEQREVNGEMQVIPQTETDTAKIVEMLEELSSDRIYVGQFENAIAEYNERTRLAVFGYMGKRCPACGKTHGEKDGLYRGIVTISPDRVFFVLSRVVSEIQKFLLDQYADIG
ncbi:hypothetical protein ACGLE7_001040 [Escherichia coli]